jgi:hypothetical protein
MRSWLEIYHVSSFRLILCHLEKSVKWVFGTLSLISFLFKKTLQSLQFLFTAIDFCDVRNEIELPLLFRLRDPLRVRINYLEFQNQLYAANLR